MQSKEYKIQLTYSRFMGEADENSGKWIPFHEYYSDEVFKELNKERDLMENYRKQVKVAKINEHSMVSIYSSKQRSGYSQLSLVYYHVDL